MTKLLLLFLDRPPIFTSSQLDKLSDIFINAGNLAFGTIVLPYFLPNVDKPETSVVGFGVTLGLYFWVMAVVIARKIG